MLPGDIVDRIQAGDELIADSHGEVSTIFTDLIGFTELSRRTSPAELVEVLNRLFSAFYIEAERHRVERIKTIGDCYMAVGGLTHSAGTGDHAENAADFALAIQQAVRHVFSNPGQPVEICIGLHIGPVVAGVIGVRRPAFDFWGEAVNLASRLESNAGAGSILISESAYDRLSTLIDVEAKDDVEMKDSGKAKVSQLNGRMLNQKTATANFVAI